MSAFRVRKRNLCRSIFTIFASFLEKMQKLHFELHDISLINYVIRTSYLSNVGTTDKTLRSIAVLASD